jgi:hypothetical protein
VWALRGKGSGGRQKKAEEGRLGSWEGGEEVREAGERKAVSVWLLRWEWRRGLCEREGNF